jgi:uncharacterized phage protein (predicted DNA packaging)
MAARRNAQAQAEADAAALRACLDYMRVDEDTDGRIESEFIPAAKAYLAGAGIPEPAEANQLYTLAVHSLTLHYYDHRDAVGEEAPFPTGLRPIINQLKHSGEGCI